MRKTVLSSALMLVAAPVDADPVWTSAGPDGGQIQGVSASPAALFAATTDGVYRSLDDGAQWERAGDLPRGMYVGAIAASPHDPNLVIAAGQGFWRSTDGGTTWAPVTAELAPAQILFNPWPGRAFEVFATAVDGAGVLRSTDHGQTWHVSSGPGGGPLRALALAASAQRSRVVAADEDRLWMTNNGTSWTQVRALPAHARSAYMVLDGTDDDKLVLSIDSTSFVSVYHYRIDLDEFTASNVFGAVSGLAGDPFGGGRIWLAGGRLMPAADPTIFESTDFGGTWPGFKSNKRVNGLLADGERLDRLYGWTVAGPEVSEDAGRTWTTRSRGIPLASTHAVALHPEAPSTVLAATDHGTVALSTDNGIHWTQHGQDSFGSPVLTLARVPGNPDAVYAATSAGSLHRSDDGGTNWQRLSAGGLTTSGGIYQLLVDGADPARMVAVQNGVYWSSNAGNTWQVAEPRDLTQLLRVVASSTAAGRIYGLRWHSAVQYSLARAERHGAPFEPVAPPGFMVSALVVHPHSDAVLVAARLDGLDVRFHLSTDAGSSWQPLGALQLRRHGYEPRLHFDPCDSNTLYAAVGDAVYRSHDLGMHWIEESLPLPAIKFTDLSAVCDGGRIRLAASDVFRSVQFREPVYVDAIWRAGFDGT